MEMFLTVVLGILIGLTCAELARAYIFHLDEKRAKQFEELFSERLEEMRADGWVFYKKNHPANQNKDFWNA